MKKINIDREWEFMLGEPSSIPGMSNETKTVNLPHDFMIESDVREDSVNGANTGYYSGATGTYTKWLEIPEEWSQKRVLVEFDGAFKDTAVILNGHRMGQHHYGYTPFRIDLSSQIKYGKKNRLAVIVSNDAEPNSRWYPGGGIYRHVSLLTAPAVHIAPDGIFAKTSHIAGEDAFVIVETEIENHTAEDRNVWVEIEIEGKTETTARNRSRGEGRTKAFVPAGSSIIARIKILIEQAEIWDIDAPNLYEIHATLTDGRDTLDTAETIFGIRTISVDAKNGLMLNGRSLKLKGGCIHHDNGLLGAASFYESEYRKVLIHKQSGYNALRFAHNPMSADLLRACDELGILVYNEAFDTWKMPKNRHDFTEHFEAEWKEELTSFIKRDRNHPSVIIWSVGNELPEQGGLSGGYQMSAELSEYVRDLDPTRFVSGALCSFFNGLDDEDNARFWQSLMEEQKPGQGALNNLDGKYGREIWNDYTEAFAAPWDVVGYNYLNYHYEEAGRLFPNRVICATESKPSQMEEYWADVQRYPYLIGDFLWTSHDYIGEAGIGKTLYADAEEVPAVAQKLHYAWYPWRTAGTGDFDLCGFETPQSAYHRIIWGSDVKVEVYSGAEEVELYVNGQKKGMEKTAHKKATFFLKYEPGILEAVSLTDGREVSRDCVKTAGRPCGIRITPDRIGLSKNVLKADGQSLCFAVIEAVDAEGNPVPYVEKTASAKVEGAAALAAFGSARPMTEENYTVGKAVSYHGRLLAIVRSGYESGEAVLTVSMEEMGEASLRLNIKGNEVQN